VTVADGGDGVAVRTGRSRLLLLSPAQAAGRYPGPAGGAAGPAPRLMAMDIAVADLAATAGWLEGQGVAAARREGGMLTVAPAQACGVALGFVPRA